MATNYSSLVPAAVRRRAAVEGIPLTTASMRTITLCAMAMASDLPREFRPALLAGAQRWLLDEGSSVPLEPYRVAAWLFLKEKNGTTITINDRVDLAMRALIGILWDEEDEEDLGDSWDFLAHLATKYGGLESALSV